MLSAQTLAEIQRKKTIGKPLTNQTPEAMKAYNGYTPPKVNMPAKTPPTSRGVPVPGKVATMGATPQVQPKPVGTPQTAQSWINNSKSGFGGIDQYTATQQGRYNDAYAQNDTAMLGKLISDSQRVGYSFQAPQHAVPQPQPSPQNQPATSQYFTPPPVTNQIPIQTQPTIPVMDMGKIGQYVDGQLGAELTRQRSAADQAINAGKTTAQQQLEALQTQYGRVRQDVADERTLENVQNQATLNPFSGKTSYQLGMVNRERGRTDREMEADLATRQANVNQGLADMQNSINAKYQALQQTQGAERERMMQSIKQDERAYESMLRGDLRQDYLANSQLRQADFGMSLDSFKTNRGVYEDDRNFGYQKSQDQIRNDAQYGGTYGGNQTVAQQQQGFENRFNYGQATGQFGNGQQTMEKQKLDYAKIRDKVSDTQWMSKFKQDVQQNGLDNAARQAGLSIDQARLALSQDDNSRQWAELDYKMQNPSGDSYKGLTPNQLLDSIRGNYTDTSYDAAGNKVINLTKDPVRKEQMFLDVVDSGLPSDAATRQVLHGLGLTKKEIDEYMKKFGATPGK